MKVATKFRATARDIPSPQLFFSSTITYPNCDDVPHSFDYAIADLWFGNLPLRMSLGQCNTIVWLTPCRIPCDAHRTRRNSFMKSIIANFPTLYSLSFLSSCIRFNSVIPQKDIDGLGFARKKVMSV